MKILISACLTGINCKYNGGNNINEELLQILQGHELIPVCPEVLGGLPVPRIPAEIVHGTVMNKEGVSVDQAFRNGAEKALAVALEAGVDGAVLKSRSPSCGTHEIYDGTFTGTRIPGTGIFAAQLKALGIPVTDEEEIIKKGVDFSDNS